MDRRKPAERSARFTRSDPARKGAGRPGGRRAGARGTRHVTWRGGGKGAGRASPVRPGVSRMLKQASSSRRKGGGPPATKPTAVALVAAAGAGVAALVKRRRSNAADEPVGEVPVGSPSAQEPAGTAAPAGPPPSQSV